MPLPVKAKNEKWHLQKVSLKLFEEITKIIEEKVVDIALNLGKASAKERFAVEQLHKDMRQILRNQRDLFSRLDMAEKTEDHSPYLQFTSSEFDFPKKP